MISSNRKYDTVIFDLDGTLLNTLDDLTDSVNYALLSEGLPQRTLSEVRIFVGNGIAQLIERAVPEGTPQEIKTSVLAGFRRHYTDNCENKTRPYDGVCELLDRLCANGFKTAVVSNKMDSAVRVLCRKYFGDRILFSVGDKEGLPRKPAPDSVFEVLKKLSSACERSVYVGDSDVDIQTARNAGMDCISVTWGFREKDFLIKSGAVMTADKPSELADLLLADDDPSNL